MVYILTLLFLSPFIDRKESRWFVSIYAFILLVTRELRIILDLAGSDVFLINSYSQVICMCFSVCLLEGKERIISTIIFLLYASYNFCIANWWGYVPLIFNPWISITVIFLQIFVVTFQEKGLIKNSLMILVATIISFVASRYI